MALVNRRWSNVSLMQLATKLSQHPAADPTTDRGKLLNTTKTITKDDFFPMIAINEDDLDFSMRTIIVPENSLKLTWDILGFLIIVYQAIIIPYQIGFDVENAGDILTVDYLVHGFFIIDILLTFSTAYYYKGTLVIRRKMIAKHYLKLWFWIDVASTFPYEMLMKLMPGGDSVYSEKGSAAYKTPQMIRMLKLINFIRILKLLRLAKLKRIIYQIEDYVSQDIIGSFFVFLRLSISGFFIAHWTACSWYMVSSIDSSEKPDTWVKVKGMWVADGASRSDAYVSALYWSVTTMNTIGYGDIYAITNNEKICAICAMVVSCGVFAYILGNISNVVNKKSEQEAVHRKRVIALNSYMKQKDLPHDLRFRVRRYLDYIWEHQAKNKMDEDDILAMLSEPLRDEIYTHTRGPVFKAYGLFENFSPTFPALLSKELYPEVFAPGDGVFDEGEKIYKMYFLMSGTVDVFHKASSSSFHLLRKGSFFGEIGFFARMPRTASIRCLEFVNMLSLTRDGIEHILTRMPDAKESIRVIEERCRDYDFSVLKIACYLCKTMGHVATSCNKMVLTRVKDDIKDKWIAGRRGNSIVVNPKFTQPNYQRKGKRIDRGRRFGTENVVGVRKDYNVMYREDSGLRNKVAEFLDEKRLVVDAHGSLPVSRRGSVNDKAPLPEKRPRRLTIILSETPAGSEESDSGSEDVSRAPSFNMNLMTARRSHERRRKSEEMESSSESSSSVEISKYQTESDKIANVELFRRGTYSQVDPS